MWVRVKVPYAVHVEVDVLVDDDLDEGAAWEAAKDEARMVAELERAKDGKTLALPRWGDAEVAEVCADWTDVDCEVQE